MLGQLPENPWSNPINPLLIEVDGRLFRMALEPACGALCHRAR